MRTMMSFPVWAGIAAGAAAGVGLAWFARPAFPSLLLLVLAAACIAAVRWAREHSLIERVDLSEEAVAGWREFNRELLRSRRLARNFALLRFRLAETDTGPTRVALSGVRRLVRRVDVAWAEGQDLYLLLPDTDRIAAQEVAARARSVAGMQPGSSPVSVVFPDDGLTSGTLIAAVQGDQPGLVHVRRLTPPAELALASSQYVLDESIAEQA